MPAMLNMRNIIPRTNNMPEKNLLAITASSMASSSTTENGRDLQGKTACLNCCENRDPRSSPENCGYKNYTSIFPFIYEEIIRRWRYGHTYIFVTTSN